MPTWVNVVVVTAAVVTAVTVIWLKGVLPVLRFASRVEQTLPLLQELVKVFRDNPQGFKVLDQIADQFRNNDGSSLRDVIDRLEEAAEDGRMASASIKVNLEAAKQLAERDRQQVERLLILLGGIAVQVEAGAATGTRIETAAGEVAADLAAAHLRADSIVDGAHGEAADAASRQTAAESIRSAEEGLEPK